MSIRSKLTRLGPRFGLCLGALALVSGAGDRTFAQDLEPMPASLPADAPTGLPIGLDRAEVLDGWQTSDGTRMAAIRVTLDPGWKTYWRHPGDAGIPPSFSFRASSNLKDVKIYWPRPEVFTQSGTRSIGYKDQMILPIELSPIDPTQPIRLDADLDLGICHDICVPVSLELDADLVGPGRRDPVISAALQAQPQKVASRASCQIEPIRDGMRVTARLPVSSLPSNNQPSNNQPAGQPPHQVALFELPSQPVWVSDSRMSLENGALVATADFVPPDAAPFDLDPKDLRITVLDKTHAIEMDGCARM
ncbi:protein-disulfide reductase DsbD family protein [Thioclava litoralis]|uniref:Protein-disulfide reductase DsbD family protein n=1 Tax=Thioclava litoralis TaxID=3076557 RepID=A0ABZ1DXF5_9RHOB|nr:protein-disulfide reductase DsbD family protein [Thioclava sp. FTW29]